jgi:hypothetical protein
MRTQQYGIAWSVFYVVRAMPIARQRVAKHVPAEMYRGTVGRPFLGNGAVNTPYEMLRENVFRGFRHKAIRV